MASELRFGQKLLFATSFCLLFFGSHSTEATDIILKDGRVLSGSVARISGLAEDPRQAPPTQGAPKPRLITMVDDNLRRTFVPKSQIAEVREGGGGSVNERFHVYQRVPRNGARIGTVGSIIAIEPFDEYGRRVFRMASPRGQLNVIQGITDITPEWTKVEGLSHIWDMRIATSSIPRETLDAVLSHQLDPGNVEHRLKLARLYIQSERYSDARAALEEIVTDFPDLEAQIQPVVIDLKQMNARRGLREIELRRNAGQHQLVQQLLEKFPAENIAGEILQEVREMRDSYRNEFESAQQLLSLLDEHLTAIGNDDLTARVQPIRDEIFAELNYETLDRLIAYRQFASDGQMLPTEKLALAISGWLVGSDNASDNLPVALSMYRIRNLLVEYFNEPTKTKRDFLLEEVLSQEGSVPDTVATIIAKMKPPYPAPTADAAEPGLFKMSIPGVDPDPEYSYYIQLPPEYDPYKRYPVIVTLHGGGTNALQQIDWWAGVRNDKGMRLGHATRHGYIVVAPEWGRQGQNEYEYSARTHALVLHSLRDACRRFSVDTDRVFISGHSMGGDAAWDLGISHPDLWAGVIPIVAISDKYCTHYWPNAEYVPFYIVSGEFDGGKSVHNARDVDRYMKRGFDVTVVEFRGRGHENFSDEVLRIFDWMNRKRRDFFPREFTCNTMRPWDNYFWWVEVSGFPERVVVDPKNWPAPRGTRPMEVSGRISPSGSINVKTGGERISVWLSPELVDYSQNLKIKHNGRQVSMPNAFIEPKVAVILEDVRTRGDRQHPFWSRVDFGR